MSDINLLSRKKDRISTSKKIIPKLNLIAITFLIATSAVSFLLFSLKLSSPLRSISNEEASLTSMLSKEKEVMEKEIILADRLENIKKISSRRRDFEALAKTVMDAATGDIVFNSVALNGKNITIDASSLSLPSINTFVTSLLTLSTQQHVLKKIILNSITLSDKGSYTALVSIEVQ